LSGPVIEVIPSNKTMIKIYIKTLTGHTISLDVWNDATIDH